MLTYVKKIVSVYLAKVLGLSNFLEHFQFRRMFFDYAIQNVNKFQNTFTDLDACT